MFAKSLKFPKKEAENDVRKIKQRMNERDKQELIKKLTAEMKNAAKLLEFEYAAEIRDKINELTQQ